MALINHNIDQYCLITDCPRQVWREQVEFQEFRKSEEVCFHLVFHKVFIFRITPKSQALQLKFGEKPANFYKILIIATSFL